MDKDEFARYVMSHEGLQAVIEAAYEKVLGNATSEQLARLDWVGKGVIRTVHRYGLSVGESTVVLYTAMVATILAGADELFKEKEVE